MEKMIDIIFSPQVHCLKNPWNRFNFVNNKIVSRLKIADKTYIFFCSWLFAAISSFSAPPANGAQTSNWEVRGEKLNFIAFPDQLLRAAFLFVFIINLLKARRLSSAVGRFRSLFRLGCSTPRKPCQNHRQLKMATGCGIGSGSSRKLNVNPTKAEKSPERQQTNRA